MPITKSRQQNADRKVTGQAARRGIWLKKPEPAVPDLSTLRTRQADTVKRTYTSVVKVPIMKYTAATDTQIQEKKERICEEKKYSSKKMEKRIKRFCHAYRLPNPDPNCHSTITKEAPWLASRADGTEHSHVVHAALPDDTDENKDHNDNNTIPLNLKQCHYFYKDTGIASWRVARTKDGEIAKLQSSTNNTSFREYAWRLSYLVCQGKRQMRLMARDKNEKCGPLPLFSKHSLVKDLDFDMPEEKDAFKHEGIPISRAVRMMFQTADLTSFEKQVAVKTGIPYGPPTLPGDDLSIDDIEVDMQEEDKNVEDGDDAVDLKKAEGIPSAEKQDQNTEDATGEAEPEPQEEETEVAPKEEAGDNNSNNGQEEAAQVEPTVGQQEAPEKSVEEVRVEMTPDPAKFPSPVLPESRTPSPTGKAKKVNSKSGCCAFL